MMHRLRALWRGLSDTPDPRRTLLLALRRPRRTLQAIARTGSTRWMVHLLGGRTAYATYVSELAASGEPERSLAVLEDRFRTIRGSTPRGNPYVHGAIKRTHARHLYSLVRALRPERVVETGVCNGLSTAVILRALEQNGRGELWSVDQPERAGESVGAARFWEGKGGAVLPADAEIGWLVPHALRARWRLKTGKSEDLLPRLLDELGSIDLFLHDSEHSLFNQMLEFGLATQHLRQGGVLIASDAGASNAFERFRGSLGSGIDVYWVDHSLALAVKKTP